MVLLTAIGLHISMTNWVYIHKRQLVIPLSPNDTGYSSSSSSNSSSSISSNNLIRAVNSMLFGGRLIALAKKQQQLLWTYVETGRLSAKYIIKYVISKGSQTLQSQLGVGMLKKHESS